METASLRPALGAGVFTGNGDGCTLSGAVDLPIFVSVPAGTTAHVVPFLSPGVGVGFISDGTDSESGARASLGAGIGLVASNGLGIHPGWRRIFIEDGPSTLGIALSFGR